MRSWRVTPRRSRDPRRGARDGRRGDRGRRRGGRCRARRVPRVDREPGSRADADANQKDASARRDERARRSEEAFAEVLARRDRAKAAIGELARRVEDVQRELNALDEEEDLEIEAEASLTREEEEEETEELSAFAPSATPRGDDAWAEYAGASEPLAEVEVEEPTGTGTPSATKPNAIGRTAGKAAVLAAERDLAAARLSRERRS